MAKFISKSYTREIVDEETGELIQVETAKEIGVKVDNEEFYMTYTKFISSLYGLTRLSDLKLLCKLCELSEYNTGLVYMTTRVRNLISRDTGISNSNISKNLKSLENSGLITREDGDYRLNPVVFWKGDRKTRQSLLLDEDLEVKLRITTDKI